LDAVRQGRRWVSPASTAAPSLGPGRRPRGAQLSVAGSYRRTSVLNVLPDLPPTSQSLPPTIEEGAPYSLLGRGERGVQEVAEGRRVSTLEV